MTILKSTSHPNTHPHLPHPLPHPPTPSLSSRLSQFAICNLQLTNVVSHLQFAIKHLTLYTSLCLSLTPPLPNLRSRHPPCHLLRTHSRGSFLDHL